jgi:very-short-patch-repair endonuclease
MKHPGRVDFALTLRQSQTDAEHKLWLKSREMQVDGIKFRRQHPLGNYIVVFACIKKKLIIEVDGGHHNESRARTHDIDRSAWLEKQGFLVLRFWDKDVLLNIDGVMSQVLQTLADAHLTLTLSLFMAREFGNESKAQFRTGY